MTSFLTPIDVQDIVKDLRRIVVDLKENDKVTQSLTYAHRVADIIQRRGGDTITRYIPGQDFEKEHKKSRNRQLRDLDNENRQLRQLYEDSQWTLFLIMQTHRRILEANFCKDQRECASSRKQNKVDNDMKQNFYVNAAKMAREIYEFLEHERKMNMDIQKRMEDLRTENDLLRRILEFESGVDIQTVADHLKKSAALKAPLISTESDYETCSDHKSLVDRGEQSTPRKQKAVVRSPILNYGL